jgi:Flp pilus assembly protein TadD
MCRNPARLATALAAALALATTASPAFALFGKAKPKPTAEAKAGEALAAQKAPPAQRAAADRLEPLARAAFWAREAQLDPADREAGLGLARALRTLGRYDEASQAAELVMVGAPNDVDAILESARAKIGGDKGFYAIEPLRRAMALAPKDWRPVSLLGVALEQSQRPEEAKAAYEQALALSPDNPSVLTNLALFHAGRGDAPGAETLLRRAVARPEATARERQNLALVLGLQGKLAEAERLMRQDLPPEVANANLAYLRTAGPAAAASSRNWGALEGQQQGAATPR